MNTAAKGPSPSIDQGLGQDSGSGVEDPPSLATIAIVETKILRPHNGEGVVARQRLLDQLAAQANGRVALVTAPAGFGKTVVLSQWAEKDPRPVAWVTLGAAETDVVRFWTYVRSAIDAIVPLADSISGRLGPGSITDEMMPTIISAMSSVPQGVLLVLDDYQEASSPDVDTATEQLIRRVPTGSCVAISSRRDPSLSLARWRAAEQLSDVRHNDLRFSEAEAADWLEARGVRLQPESIRTSLDITEGWPAAYALAMGSILTADDPDSVLGSLRGDDRHIADYINDEVLSGLDARDRDVLVCAAACSEVCGQLVDQMLETTGSAAVLDRLSRSDVLLEQVGSTGTWYRLHRLLSEFLLTAVGDALNEDGRYGRAAEWFAAQGRPRDALEVALASGDHRLAVVMINRGWTAYMLAGQVNTLKRDLSQIDPSEASRNSTFLITQAWVYATEGRHRDALYTIEQAETHDDGLPLPDGCPSVAAAAELIKALFVLEGLESGWKSAEIASSLVPDSSQFRPVADLAIGSVALFRGDLSIARPAMLRARIAAEPLLRLTTLGWLILIDVLDGDRPNALSRFEEMKSAIDDDAGLADLPVVIISTAVLDLAAGRPMDCAAALEKCLLRLGSDDPPVRLELLIWLATAEAGVGRADRAREAIDQAREIVTNLGGSSWHSHRLDDVAEQLAPSKALVGIDPGLTDRERRILQLLASTHLSQREIGRELNIAFNTVKSHVKSIYVKIGATSREEASQIARVRGLI